MYGALFRHVLFPAWETGVRRRPTLTHLAELEHTQWLSRDELVARQGASLRGLVAHLWDNVPFYRRRMEDAGLSPTSLREVSDLPKLPIVSRPELAATVMVRTSIAPPFPMIAKSTSGSTGTPLVFGYDAGSEHWRQATKLRGYGWAGYRAGDRAIHYWGSSPVRPTRLRAAKIELDHRVRRDTYIDCVHRDRASLDAAVDVIRRVRPQAFVCFAQAGADLARHVNEHGLRDWDDVRVLTGAERLLPADRAAFQRAFGPQVFETYGCREVMLIGSECEAHAGLHTSMENLVVELVVRDGDRERPAEPGETGEVVLTDLHNYGMPFLRYANGDVATRAAIGTCSCGRSLERLASIEGRVTETLRDGKGGRVSGLAFSVVFVTIAEAARQFQVVQHADDRITIRIVPTARFGDEARAAVLATVAKYLPGIPATVELVTELPASASGKRSIVVVEPPAKPAA